MKISKNLKRLRNSKGMSQEALALKLNVTRQTVSSYENDRTQPDLEMLEAIAAALETNIETLIYGEKGDKTDPNRSRKTLIVVFSILGSLLIGVGLILIFYNYWRSFAQGVKFFFAFLPMLLGQGAALYTYLKKKSSIAFCEGAAALWVIGVSATIGLVSSITGLHFGFHLCLLIDGLLCLPAVYLLNTIIPLPFYYAALIQWGYWWLLSAKYRELDFFVAGRQFNLFYDNNHPWQLLIFFIAFTVLFCLGAGFFVRRRNKDTLRRKFSVWICTMATFIGILLFTVELKCFLPILLSLSMVLFLLAKPGTDFYLPFRIVGTLGTLVLMIASCFIEIDPFPWKGTLLTSVSFYVVSALTLLPSVLCAVLQRKELKKDLPKLLYAVFIYAGTALLLILFVLSNSIAALNTTFDLASLIIVPFICAAGVALIIDGAKTDRLLRLNVGLLTEAAMICRLISFAKLSFVLIGVLFIVLGGAILSINVFLLHRKKQHKAQETASKPEGGNASC